MNAQPEMCLQATVVARVSQAYGTPRRTGGTFCWPVSPKGWSSVVEIRLECAQGPQECLVRVCAPTLALGEGETYAIIRDAEGLEHLMRRLGGILPHS